MSKLVIQHDLSKFSAEQLEQYKKDISEYVGIPPALNAFDTIWMQNENGPGQSLVVYARRGTAEILRNIYGIEVSSLTNQMVKGSIVFTAIGKNAKGRQEVATGSKYIESLTGKMLDDAIMTSSTRALRRLTMQFTSLGILDESEVKALVGDTVNPAAGATLAGSPMVIPPPTVAPNNAPGRDVTPPPTTAPKEDVQADIKPDTAASNTLITSVVAPVTDMPEADTEAAKPKRARRPKNTVSMEVEPETVSTPETPRIIEIPTAAPLPEQVIAAVPTQAFAAVAVPAVPTTGTPVPNPGTQFPDKPTDAQMSDYRKRVSVYTSQLPSSENLGSVQKMRAFITKMTDGTTPQFMTTEQWDDVLAWFEAFTAKNSMKELVTHINDALGVK